MTCAARSDAATGGSVRGQIRLPPPLWGSGQPRWRKIAARGLLVYTLGGVAQGMPSADHHLSEALQEVVELESELAPGLLLGDFLRASGL